MRLQPGKCSAQFQAFGDACLWGDGGTVQLATALQWAAAKIETSWTCCPFIEQDCSYIYLCIVLWGTYEYLGFLLQGWASSVFNELCFSQPESAFILAQPLALYNFII